MERFQRHPAFPQPEDLGLKIWRYLEFDKFEWLCKNQRLLMPTAEFLGDSLEGTQPTGDAKWWEAEAKKAEGEKRDIIKSNAQNILAMAQQFRNNYFVSCWHINEHENEKMWRCYTKSSESVAISTSYKKLVEMLPASLYSGLVTYIDYRKDKLPTFNLFQYITHKDTSYCFENEIRIVAAALIDAHYESETFKGNIFTLDAKPDFRFYAPRLDVSLMIDQLVLHPQATEKFISKVSNCCSEFCLPKPQKSPLVVRCI